MHTLYMPGDWTRHCTSQELRAPAFKDFVYCWRLSPLRDAGETIGPDFAGLDLQAVVRSRRPRGDTGASEDAGARGVRRNFQRVVAEKTHSVAVILAIALPEMTHNDFFSDGDGLSASSNPKFHARLIGHNGVVHLIRAVLGPSPAMAPLNRQLLDLTSGLKQTLIEALDAEREKSRSLLTATGSGAVSIDGKWLVALTSRAKCAHPNLMGRYNHRPATS